MSEDLVGASGGVLDDVVAAMGGTPREGQASMAAEAAMAIEERRHLMVQAGTGTGKSIGYLTPLLTHCALNGVRGLVSTATLALQRQILVKDAPAVVDAVAARTGVRLDVRVLKGWSNYVCLHRLQGGHPAEDTLFEDRDPGAGTEPTGELGRQIVRLREWARASDTGDRDDLEPGVPDRVWHYASVAKPECLGRHCPLVDDCFAQRARDAAAEADVVITNHSLFGINATEGSSLFGEIDAVVVDEAHELADRVRSQAARDITPARVARAARSLRSALSLDVSDLEEAGNGLGAALAPLPDGLLEKRPAALVDAMAVLDDAVRRAQQEVGEAEADQAAKLLARGAVEELAGALDEWGRDPDRSIAYVSRTEPGAERLTVGPLDVAGPLGAVGFGERPAILTSATLALGGSFDFMAAECGLALSPVPWHGIDVGSPFDPAAQAIRYVARRLPVPGRDGPPPAVLDELVELAQASGGGVLALFASRRGAQAGAEALRGRTDFEVLVQGEGTLSALIDRFRDERDSCLVGTLSLWQGVDVVGPSCRLVVIDKIPFPRPDDPVTKARCMDVERRGGSGFRAVSLTHAALLMAQGAGRLLRSDTDRGVVAVLDPRLGTKPYGRFILASMPPMWPTEDPQVVRGALRRLNARK